METEVGSGQALQVSEWAGEGARAGSGRTPRQGHLRWGPGSRPECTPTGSYLRRSAGQLAPRPQASARVCCGEPQAGESYRGSGPPSPAPTPSPCLSPQGPRAELVGKQVPPGKGTRAAGVGRGGGWSPGRASGAPSLPPREAAGYLRPPGGRVLPAAPPPQNGPVWGWGHLRLCSVTPRRAAGGRGTGPRPFRGSRRCWGKRPGPSCHPHSSGI